MRCDYGKFISVLFVLFYSIMATGLEAEEQCPESSRRLKLNFNRDWRFYRGEIEQDSARFPAYNDISWQTVQLPHAPKIMPLRQPWRPDFEGINWYRKQFCLPEDFADAKLFIEFEGADQVTEVWINGTHVATHIGAYLPFTVDISDQTLFGDQGNVITVKVSNFVDQNIPVYGAWYSFGGLYRDVNLHITDRLYISNPIYAGKAADGGVFIRYPQVDQSSAQIQIRTNVVNEYAMAKRCRVVNVLVDAEGNRVARTETRTRIKAGEDESVDQLMQVTGVHLWHPDHPYLYTMQTNVYTGKKLVDCYHTHIGIRRIDFDSDGFRINGERFVFMGANRVQEYPYVSWAVPDAAQKRDALRLKEGGFQYVRTSHNPQDQAFLDACDELGILVMDCTPGFQYIGGNRFREHSFQNMRDMIRRDRNHPSVISWELSLNETDFDSSFAQTAMCIGHEEYPGDQCYVAGWKLPDIYDVFLQASQHGARNYSHSAPLVISEYGHWDYGGGNSSSDVDRMNGERAMLLQARNHQESLNLNRGLPFLCGDGLWVAIDFQFFPSGVLDYFRLPKFSYYFFQSQRDPEHIIKDVDSGPMVYIANYWTQDSPDTVTVYSNCEQVDLFLNDRLIASQIPDTGRFSENLLHPPFTFRDIAWESGKLEAIAYIDNQETASHVRITPDTTVSIALRFDVRDSTIAEGDDLLFVYASLIDTNGTVVHNDKKIISFQVNGSGTLISPKQVQTEAGIATALVRIYDETGQIVVKAEAKGLKPAGISRKCVRKINTTLY
ncbi:MAG: DUF4982 domain-containing protein [Candidatus Marinimicrobia bacterium]|nr:DUF4982 domain-containing protein [Candidatus Neomarinimicrobiota bacterium]